MAWPRGERGARGHPDVAVVNGHDSDDRPSRSASLFFSQAPVAIQRVSGYCRTHRVGHRPDLCSAGLRADAIPAIDAFRSRRSGGPWVSVGSADLCASVSSSSCPTRDAGIAALERSPNRPRPALAPSALAWILASSERSGPHRRHVCRTARGRRDWDDMDRLAARSRSGCADRHVPSSRWWYSAFHQPFQQCRSSST